MFAKFKVIVFLVLAVAGLLYIGKDIPVGFSEKNLLGTKSTGSNRGSTKPVNNPFGVMFADPRRVAKAIELGVKYYRPLSVSTTNWTGSCAECDTALTNNLKLILTIRHDGGAGQPSSFPTDLSSYSGTVTSILTKYKPELLVVENEENSTLFYTGTPEQYHQQLKAGCDVAHAKGVKCTNGGLVSDLVVFLVIDDMVKKGQIGQADQYLKDTIADKLLALFGVTSLTAKELVARPAVAVLITKGKALMAGYKGAGANYVNFHWYVANASTLNAAKSYLESASGLPAITNEIGQQGNTDPGQVTADMQKVMELKLPYAVWFSADISGFGDAKSLLDESGNLRPNGVAFRDFIASQNFR